MEAGCFTQNAIKFLELIVNGKTFSQTEVSPGKKTVSASTRVVFKESGWLALRARGIKNNPDNWHRQVTAAHSSPIYVTINGRSQAVRSSAQYMVARLDTTLRWAEEDALWSSPQYKAKALAGIEQARQFYQAALMRAR